MQENKAAEKQLPFALYSNKINTRINDRTKKTTTSKRQNNQDRLFRAKQKSQIQKKKNVNSHVEFLSFSRFLRQFQIFHLDF